MQTNQAEYQEIQGFRIRFVWAAVIAFNILFLYAIIQQVVVGAPFGSKPAPDWVLFLLQFLMLSVLYLLFSIRLKTTINTDGIYYRFYPFQTKTTHIEWTELSDAYMREYSSFYEYGGWGMRVGANKNSRAINTSASSMIGLQLEFKDGRLLMIGTKKPEELSAVIEKYMEAGRIKWGA